MFRFFSLLLVLVVLVAPTSASAAGLSRENAAKVERLARSLGSRSGFVVTDTKGRTLAAVRPGTRRTMGSVTKLFTTSAALLDLEDTAPDGGGAARHPGARRPAHRRHRPARRR